jgi:hypothetical protein
LLLVVPALFLRTAAPSASFRVKPGTAASQTEHREASSHVPARLVNIVINFCPARGRRYPV